jgi:hypothetical protein
MLLHLSLYDLADLVPRFCDLADHDDLSGCKRCRYHAHTTAEVLSHALERGGSRLVPCEGEA